MLERQRVLDKLNTKRKALIKAGGVKCVNCGCNNIAALEINKKLFDVRCRPCNELYYLESKGIINNWKITYD